MPWGRASTTLVGDYQEKSLGIPRCPSSPSDGRAPQVPRVDRAVPRRDADERALRRAGRRATASRSSPDAAQDADLAAPEQKVVVAVRLRRPAIRGRACATLRRARAQHGPCATSTSACTRASRSIARWAAPASACTSWPTRRPPLLQRAAGRGDRGVVHVRARDPEAPARAVRLLPREVDTAGRLAIGAFAPFAGDHGSSGRAPGTTLQPPAPPRRTDRRAVTAQDRRGARARRSRGGGRVGCSRAGRPSEGHVHHDPQGRDDRDRRPQRRHRERRHARGASSKSVARIRSSRSSTATSPRRASSSRRRAAATSRSSCRRAPRPCTSTPSRRARTSELDGKSLARLRSTITTLRAVGIAVQYVIKKTGYHAAGRLTRRSLARAKRCGWCFPLAGVRRARAR